MHTFGIRPQIHSLTAGGAYGTTVLLRFLGYHCKQSSALINTEEKMRIQESIGGFFFFFFLYCPQVEICQGNTIHNNSKK